MVFSINTATQALHECSKQSLRNQNTNNYSPRTFAEQTATAVPAPTLFNFRHPVGYAQDIPISLPTVAECAAHLELLHAFHSLRLQVVASTQLDEVFSIKPEPRIVFRTTHARQRWNRAPVKLRDETFEERQAAKWLFYLRVAAARFLHWTNAIESSTSVHISAIPMPPIDILMVWHALLLNPRWFRSFEGGKLRRLCELPFPWEAIHKSIDSEDRSWLFKLPSDGSASFAVKNGLCPDLLQALTEANRSPKLIKILRGCNDQEASAKSISINQGELAQALRDPAGLNTNEQGLLPRMQEIGNATVSQLAEAVQRQSLFVDKMETQLWIRSPAIHGTLVRAITRYDRFLKLMKLYPDTMLVPTLDIDLAWHTHQCSPAQYLATTKSLAGRFIDHDDKIGPSTLDTGLQKTTDLYKIRFAGEYQYCCCWDCEMLKSAIEEDTEAGVDYSEIAQRVHDKVAHYRAIEIERRHSIGAGTAI